MATHHTPARITSRGTRTRSAPHTHLHGPPAPGPFPRSPADPPSPGAASAGALRAAGALRVALAGRRCRDAGGSDRRGAVPVMSGAVRQRWAVLPRLPARLGARPCSAPGSAPLRSAPGSARSAGSPAAPLQSRSGMVRPWARGGRAGAGRAARGAARSHPLPVSRSPSPEQRRDPAASSRAPPGSAARFAPA